MTGTPNHLLGGYGGLYWRAAAKKHLKNPLHLTILTLVIAYQLEYLALAYLRPTQLWWDWSDQSAYMQSTAAFTRGDLSSSQHHYPPLYSLVGSLFLPFSPNHPFWLPNQLLLVAYGVLYLKLTERYIGAWPAMLTLLLGTIAFWPIFWQWVIPWTTTLSAVLILAALHLFERYRRMRVQECTSPRAIAVNSFLFGLVCGCQAATRPIDCVLILPVALIYGAHLLSDLVASDDRRKFAARAIAAGIAGFLPMLALYMGFQKLVHGSLFGGTYYSDISSVGFELTGIASKLHSHLFDSAAVYGELNQHWLARIPLVAIAALFVPAALIFGPTVFRIMAASLLLQFVLYYSFVDIIPNGSFRFFNIHYFKWAFAPCLAMAWWLLQGTLDPRLGRLRQSVTAAGMTLVLALTAFGAGVRLERLPLAVTGSSQDGMTLRLPARSVDIISLWGISGRWEAIYFSRGFAIDLDGRRLKKAADYHAIPLPGRGVRIVFTRPIAASEARITLSQGVRFDADLAGSGPEAGLVRYRWQLTAQREPAHVAPVAYQLGTDIDFKTGGTADHYLMQGWSGGESWGRWMDGEPAVVMMKVPGREGHDLDLTLYARAIFVFWRKTIRPVVFANSCELGRQTVTGNSGEKFTMRIPGNCIANDDILKITFSDLSPVSPRTLSFSSDNRRLSLGVSSMRINRADPHLR